MSLSIYPKVANQTVQLPNWHKSKLLVFHLTLTALHKYLQAQRAVAVKSKPPLETVPEVQAAITAAEQAVAPHGRVLVRYSGTEPKLRILLEGRDAALLEDHADRIAAKVRENL